MTQNTAKYSSNNDFNEWPRVPGIQEAFVHDMLTECLKTQWQSEKKIKTGQLDQIEILLGHARFNSPYYGQMVSRLNLSKAKVFADIWKLVPPHSLETIMQAGKSMLSKNVPAEHGGINNIQLLVRGYAPVPILSTSLCLIMQISLFARLVHDHKWNQMATLIDIRQGTEAGFKEQSNGWGFATQSGKHISGEINVGETKLPAWLTSVSDDFYCRMDSEILAKILASVDAGEIEGFKGAIVYIETQKQFNLCKQAASKGLSIIPVVEQQGFGMIAAACPEEGSLHLQSETVLVENISNRVLVSSLHNYAMPLIKVASKLPIKFARPCGCGRGLEVVRLTR